MLSQNARDVRSAAHGRAAKPAAPEDGLPRRTLAPARPSAIEDILQAAEHAFAQSGYANTALSAIARRAGVTKSLIHHYFGSKNALWTVVHARQLQRLEEAAATQVDPESPTNGSNSKTAMRGYFEFLRHNQQLFRLLSWAALEHPSGDEVGGFAAAEQIVQQLKRARADASPDQSEVALLLARLATHGWLALRQSLGEKSTASTPAELDDWFVDRLERLLSPLHGQR